MEQIKVEHISYSYQNQYQKIEAVKDISCGFEAGSLYAIVGESGSGKSTFLSLLAGLDAPDSGRVLIGMRTAESRRQSSIRHFICFRF